MLYASRRNDTMTTFSERHGPKRIDYVLSPNGTMTVREKTSSANANLTLFHVKKGFEQIFLPQGYPESVSSDYMKYQIWDTVQAFCSTISGTLTTHAIFRGVGVGDTSATALSATITWIMKDGTGMIGRIGFAWWQGYSLDTDCKKWRMAADIINDVAMCVELLLGSVYLKDYGPILLCCSTGMKSIVGVAGGATRAAITQHQAIRNNMADVSAKDGSQETCVNLIASFVALYILTRIEYSSGLIWALFFSVTILHIFANYKAVKSLKIKSLNENRLFLLIKYFWESGEIFGPDKINLEEAVLPGFSNIDYSFCKRKIYLGKSMKRVISKFDADYLRELGLVYEAFPYFIVYDDESLYVGLRENISDRDVIMSYFHALVLGVHCDFQDNTKSSIQDSTEYKSVETLANMYVMKNWVPFIKTVEAKS